MHGVWRESVTVVCRLGECRQELLDPYQRGSTRAAQYPLLSLSSPTTCYTLTHYTALHILNCINATNYYVQILMTLNTQCTNIREHCIKSEICFRTYYRRIVFIWCSIQNYLHCDRYRCFPYMEYLIDIRTVAWKGTI